MWGVGEASPWGPGSTFLMHAAVPDIRIYPATSSEFRKYPAPETELRISNKSIRVQNILHQ
jgi:hypothetical protein